MSAMSAIVRRLWRRPAVDLDVDEYAGRHRRDDAAPPPPSPIPAGHTQRDYGLAA